MGFSTILTAGLLALRLLAAPVSAAPVDSSSISSSIASVAASEKVSAAASDWWFATIERNGAVPFGSGGDGYKVFRNVADYGAKGDGSTDDTEAINAAITDGGNRCGLGCDSSTTTPALVYFPPGTYVVSAPIITYYYTHMVGDLKNLPVLKAAPTFQGIAVIDANPRNGENNWFTNQNNFFRQIRNFRIDLTGLPMTTGTGIHWQVAQATSLQNIIFDMVEDKSENNVQQGIFMENGSGGYMIDLVFNGGGLGAFFGSQQFTAKDLVFNNCNVGIYQIWNWIWAYHGLEFNGCGIGIDMTSGDPQQDVGSITLQDSTFTNTQVGIASRYSPEQGKWTNGTIVLDNVDMSGAATAIQNTKTGTTILAGGSKVASFIQGRAQSSGGVEAVQGTRDPINKPDVLLDGEGRMVSKQKPQYPDVPASKFVSVKAAGAKGDGSTDDTAAIQAVFDKIAEDEVVYFDHGAYVLTDTVDIPSNVRIVGEIWPMIMAGGDSNFQDQNNPKPMLRVGQPGSTGNVEIQDLMIETKGPQPGAILMEWNVAGESKGSAGLFDVHFRVGGSAGTNLQSDKCSKTPDQTTEANPECIGAFMLMHVTADASIIMENDWLWVSDHELDRSDFNQINIYNGRGILIESTKGAWLWGTASEHSTLYNYQIDKAENVFMSCIQTETAYFQGNPDALKPFTPQSKWNDPTFEDCKTDNCARTWGMRVLDSKDVLLYGGGLYSFFNNYGQTCLDTEDCQENMVEVNNSQATLLALSTKASVSMLNVDGQVVAKHLDNDNNFCATLAFFQS